MQKPRLELNQELTLEQVMTSIEVLEEQIKNLTRHIDSLTEEIKDLKRVQQDRVENHEKRIVLLEERVARQSWVMNIITSAVVLSIVGAILAIVIKH